MWLLFLHPDGKGGRWKQLVTDQQTKHLDCEWRRKFTSAQLRMMEEAADVKWFSSVFILEILEPVRNVCIWLMGKRSAHNWLWSCQAWLKPGHVCTVMVWIQTPNLLPRAVERTLGRRDTSPLYDLFITINLFLSSASFFINEAVLHLGFEFHSDLPSKRSCDI